MVTRLFDIIQPTRAYFGEKDFQQLAIIRHMSAKLNYNVDVVGCPTLREKDGLAMSSRNTLLDPKSRKSSTVVYKALSEIKGCISNRPFSQLMREAEKTLKGVNGLKFEYLDFVNPKTLEPIDENWNGSIQAALQFGLVE